MNKFVVIFLVTLFVFIGTGKGLAQTNPASGSIKINSVDYPYLIKGNGTPCLIYGINKYYIKAFSANFRNNLKCYFVDSRFVIPSAPVDTITPFTIDEAVNEIEAIREALNIDKMILVGHSILGLVVLEYGHRYPTHVSHILAIGTLPELSQNQNKIAADYWNKNASTQRKEMLAKNLKALTKDSLAKLTPSDRFIANVVAVAPKRWYDATYDENKLLTGIQYNVPVLNQLMGRDYYLFKDSTKIKPPVFLAMGKYDFVCPFVAWEKYLSLFNDISFQVFDFSGHDPQVEEPEKFDSLVLKWLRETR